MISKVEYPDTQYVRLVKQLIDTIDPQDIGKGSVFEHARHYFTLTPELEKHTASLERQLAHANADDRALLVRKLKKNRRQIDREKRERQNLIHRIVRQIVTLTEGETYEETQQSSARFLGTLLLLTRGGHGNYSRFHQRLKPLYKAALALRLIDRMFNEQTLRHSYLSKHKDILRRFENYPGAYARWLENIAYPIIVSALLQDIGLQHPDAFKILTGEDGDEDEFRVLDNEERKQLLKLNYQSTLQYLRHGIMADHSDLLSDEEKETAPSTEDDRRATHQFMVALVQDTFAGKSGLGDILKIPQVYTSVVLSTKPKYSRMLLPKAYVIIEQMAHKGVINKKLTEQFLGIVGYFPQGFGICYIPVSDKGMEKDQYEYAIVTNLNPANPMAPICRNVTRNLTFHTNGHEETIPKDRNLFFNSTKKKLMKLGKERMVEIMSNMTQNFTAEDAENFIPSFWEPYDFFSEKRYQVLWKRA